MSFFELLQQSMPMFLRGMLLTVELSVVSLVIAMFIGLGSCLMNISKLKMLHWISQCYINVIRGTPLLVQTFFIYFGVTKAFGFTMTAMTAGIVALSLNAGAYLSEIFRGGIEAVPHGQMEASRSLGMSYRATMLRVILPQALRIVVPSVVNQCIITIKDTSIISVIGLAELTMVGSQIIARTYRSFEIWVCVGVLYFVIIYALSKLSKFVEKRLSLVKGGDKESS
ncbi:MAG: amino acid ABC transporter permease [Coriobacteriales bacterium]|jgi:His/Glu/Gln/Arg/opine family amino acid ABC transporter permease subunit|nr:amino acid ABC transporter permease [Coriobacteriales bacterium]